MRPTAIEPRTEAPELEAPEMPDLFLNAACAEVLACAVAGEHHLLLAGPPGSGKTTAIELVNALMEPPPPEVFAHARRLHRLSGEDLRWRPFIQPHHSVSSLAMVGGGHPPRPGEITRAHGGCLVMDEFLEFDPRVQEALREPIERGWIRLARGPSVRQYPARFLLLGTTNLCPCGCYLPGREELCRCARARRASYAARLKGPFLDRFGLLALTDGWSRTLEVPASEVAMRIRAASLFRRTTRGQDEPNGRLREEAITPWLTDFQRRELVAPVAGSRRRHLAVLRAARTFADLDLSEPILNRHLEKAVNWGRSSFSDIERMDG